MKKEVKIALVAIAGIVIMYFGMNFLKGMSVFADKNIYYATFEDINGLSASNPIFTNGYQVGVVKDILFDYGGNNHIVVRFCLNNDKMRLPKGTTATVASDFMGNVKMDLNIPESGENGLYNIGDTIQGEVYAGLMARAATIVPQVEQMMPKIDSIITNLNALTGDPALANSLHNTEAITASLTTTTRQLNTLVNSLNQQIPGLMTKADSVLGNTQKLTRNLAKVDIDATMQRVDQTLANVQDITEKLNDPSGTAGLILNDPSLYNRLNGTLRSAQELLQDFREHPRRYINFSVFGRKEK